MAIKVYHSQWQGKTGDDKTGIAVFQIGKNIINVRLESFNRFLALDKMMRQMEENGYKKGIDAVASRLDGMIEDTKRAGRLKY